MVCTVWADEQCIQLQNLVRRKGSRLSKRCGIALPRYLIISLVMQLHSSSDPQQRLRTALTCSTDEARCMGSASVATIILSLNWQSATRPRAVCHTGQPSALSSSLPNCRNHFSPKYAPQMECRSAPWAEKEPSIGMQFVLVHTCPAPIQPLLQGHSCLTIAVNSSD